MINLLLAIHNHQPVGNFGSVFETGFKKCYWPILTTLAKYPKIKMSLHHSGPLLDWAKEREPNYLKTLVNMVKNGQIEPLGGGYYEPILAIIPDRDAAGQIKMMKDFWKAEAGIEPKGIWTTERIWEPSLASLLHDCGVKYTILDDEHFRAAGMDSQFVLNYHLTERHGKKLAIFASDQTLRYYIPFKSPEDVIAHLLYLAEKYPGSAVAYGDDGEKFGMWPGTYEWVIQKGWLEKFFKLLSENSDKIKCATLTEFYTNNKPAGNVYLPTCSYHEMGEWAMPASSMEKLDNVKSFLTNSGKWEEAKSFVRGGYWDNFLTKYPESNYMHKRMLYVSALVKNAEESRHPNAEAARKALYQAQCNCPYWHGLFGGLYLNYLRNAIYKNLLDAEKLLKQHSQSATIGSFDIDCDSNEEIIVANDKIFSVLKPSAGASLMEISYLPCSLNLTDVLARRKEAYHKKSAEATQSASSDNSGIPSIHDINKKVPDLSLFAYDPCERYSFMDHIWDGDVSPEGSASNRDTNLIRLCHLPFKVNNSGNGIVSMGTLFGGDKDKKIPPFTLSKTFTLNGGSIKGHYNIKFESPTEKKLRFGTEFNLTLLAGNDAGRYFMDATGKKQLMNYAGVDLNTKYLTLVDEFFKFKLNIRSDKEMDLWRYPVNTLSQSESGFDLLYQGSCIIFSAVLGENSKDFECEFTLDFQNHT